jgi:pyridoxal phosphate enzyme (YggS family)
MTGTLPESLASRFAIVRENIAAACTRANRPIESVTLIAVSKTHPAESVIAAVDCGHTHFGENRIEEASAKISQVQMKVTQPLTWHMIGHVQSRKAEEVVSRFDVIHSLDSLKLAERYSRFALAHNKTPSVYVEINVSGEASKEGISAWNWQHDRTVRDTLWNEIRQIVGLPAIKVVGLMTMAPIVDDIEQARPVFRELRLLRDALAEDFPESAWASLSMGMTDDYSVAIEEGATVVRIGRALFGPRG